MALRQAAVLIGLIAVAIAGSGHVSAQSSAAPASGPSASVAAPADSTAAVATAPSSSDEGLITGFVQRSGTRFVVQSADGDPDSCQTFYFAGANAYYIGMRSADPSLRPQVLEILDSAQQLGLTVLRVWAFNDGPTQDHALQRYPGQYDEGTWQGYDFAMNEASKRGIRLVLVFANYWANYGGVDQYNQWSFQAGVGTCNADSECRDEFYTDPMAAQYYRDHVSTVLNRRNTINGRLYREDPTIFGYNLMNEPRSQNELFIIQRVTTDALALPYNISYNQGNDLQQWIEDMAGYVKSIDPIHLLTIGSEGFAGNYTPMYLYANPGAWGSLLGVDFVRNHMIPGIDYATMHVYVDQWYCVAEGADEEGQLSFLLDWLEAHQQAAEEDLMMPVVLEEFGSKLDARVGQYKTAYDSCLASAERGGGCAGVMFWDLTHKAFEAIDPWLDGVLRYGGGYSNWLPADDSARSEIFNLVTNYSSSVARINKDSAGTGTCVWAPPPKMGLGCKNLDMKLQLGGLPWTCLQGEPTGLNWCNAADAANVYKDPPEAWLSTDGRDLPYNTVEMLILGNLTNNGSTPINLKGAWIIIPYSMNVQTEYEGVWQRITDPNEYFTVYCWAIQGGGLYDLCQDGTDVSFTNFTWPMGTKYDRGVNISFTADIMLQPGGSLSGAGGSEGSAVMISFKDATHAFRMDVSDTGIDGATSCPEDPEIASWPPGPPPAPIPCSQGKTANRGCPQLQWYFDKQPSSAANSVSTSSITQAGRKLFQEDPILADPPVTWANPMPVPGNPANVTTTANKDVFSVSTPPVSATSVGFQLNKQQIITATLTASGNPRSSAAVSKTQGTAVGSDTPHPDAQGGGSKVIGNEVWLVMTYLPTGFSSPQYMVVGSNASLNGAPTQVFGVVELDINATNVQFFAESPFPNMQLTLTNLKVTDPVALSTGTATLPADTIDVYSPCILPPGQNDAVFNVSLPAGTNDVLDTTLCSPGGYDQVLRVYNNGKLVARTDQPGQAIVYNISSLPITGGSVYYFVVNGASGDPYGNYRAHPGLRFKWQSGRAFNGKYDAAPMDTALFVRSENGQLLKGCDREAYVGCNTWDLMDKSRYPSERPEIESRMDAMVQAGWKVGRTWGFSLGTGTSDGGALGETVADPSSTLETAPGVYNEAVWESLDFVLDEASKRNLSLIIPIEDYWLSIDRYINWSDTATEKNDFYIDWTIRNLYKDHLTVYTSRINSINGKRYSEDPAVYAWDLINEPRCTGCGWALQAWVEEMAVFMKAIDPNHMVGIGGEGFYGTTCDRVYLNPGAGQRRTGISSSPWASQEGQDFLSNNVVPDVDFATVHIWMDNWLGYADFSTCILCDPNFDYTYGGDVWKEKLDYTVTWLNAHIEDATRLGKPTLIEEFGKAVKAAKIFEGGVPNAPEKGETVASNDSIRNIFFQTIYGLISESAQANGPAQGSNFWNLYTPNIADDDPFKVTLDDTSTMAIVKAHQQNMSAVADRAGTCPSTTQAQESIAQASSHGVSTAAPFVAADEALAPTAV
ncbi:hypothetical protein WJX73_007485 [Symbiochloris irregularis]|uniref:mannan endo-1,4-beta-mannosidase n=1 Tax=Symbiochloris irregularis TaxID=706552 RepID=A0AAW1PV25_9CHLO